MQYKLERSNMTDQKLSLSQNDIPEKWREMFVIKRINEEDIVISLEQRDGILKALNDGARFVQIRKHTLMLNSIKSIDPYWDNEENIPPRPRENQVITGTTGNVMLYVVDNEEEIALWDKLFGSRRMLND